MELEWRRLVEGILVAILLFVSLTLFGNPQETLKTLETVNTMLFGFALLTTLIGVIIWSGTVGALLRGQGYHLRLGYFQGVYIAGMGVRSVIPGGSTIGPAILAYLMTRTMAVSGERSVAAAYIAEVFLWVGSAVVGTTGALGIILFGHPSKGFSDLVVGLGLLTGFVFGVILYGIFHPAPIEKRVHHWVMIAHEIVDAHAPSLARYIHPSKIENHLDRFFSVFRHLSDDPMHALPSVGAAVAGWFVHATTLYVVLLAIGVHPPYSVALFIVPVGGLAEGASILPGGTGSVSPSIIALLLFLTPIDLPTATTAVLLYRLSNYWFRLALGFLTLSLLGLDNLLRDSLQLSSTQQH